jgi:hypothetical protein
LASAALLLAVPRSAALAQQAGPDTSFGALVTRLSEPGGYFDSDNIISNESSYLQVASQLASVGVQGGAYIGVGPDQNFSYIALIHPTVAFIVDIRRDNLLEQLLFKALFTAGRNRLEYLCLLLGKPVPGDLEDWSDRPLNEVLAYLDKTRVDSAAVRADRRAVNDRIARFGVPLDARDRAMIARYWSEFIASGLDTRYSSIGRDNRADYPNLRDLIVATDRAGRQLSYVANEDEYRYVRSMEIRNRIIPVVGNVAGAKALPAMAQYLTDHQLVVSAFYLSNVEQYLMGRDGGFAQYVENVKKLPRDSASVIIRSYFGRFGRPHPLALPGNISASMIEPIDSFVRAYDAGELETYTDLAFGRFVQP